MTLTLRVAVAQGEEVGVLVAVGGGGGNTVMLLVITSCVCGSGSSFDNDYAVCVPDDGTPCPITLLGSPDGDDWTASENSGASWNTILNLPGTAILDTTQAINENSTFYFDREMTKVARTTYTGLPIVDIKMAFSSNWNGIEQSLNTQIMA